MSSISRPNWWIVSALVIGSFLLGRCEEQGNAYDRGFDAGFALRQPSIESARGAAPAGFVSLDDRMTRLAATSPTTVSFHGYDCTEDCSGHEAGYAWAEENSITDPEVCDGHSQSFIEGCMAWAEEN